MIIKTRSVNFDSDKEILLGILERNLKELPHTRRFNWLYRNNPAGHAWSWFAYEHETKKIVGVASVFPRALWIGREIKLCGQVGDFAIEATHRTLGPALMLQRATFEPVNRGILALCYDCPPHDQGMSTFRRLGIPANCQMQRYARLLKTDRQLAKYLSSGKVLISVAVLGNLLLDLWTLRRHRVKGLEISFHPHRFDEEFSRLDEQVGGGDGIRSRRKAEDLNWRYREDPLHQYSVLTARRGGELQAFVVFSISDQDAYIIDLFGFVSPEVGLQLLEAVVEYLKKESIQALYAIISQESSLFPIFQKAHFYYRSKAANVVAYAQPNNLVQTLLSKQPKWSFNYVDILA
jgi:hypothetical protein